MIPEKNVGDPNERNASPVNQPGLIVAQCRKPFQQGWIPGMSRFLEKLDDELSDWQ